MMRVKSQKNEMNIVYNKDARTIAETISSTIRIQTTITSPPYFDLKDYDSENQIGYGQTYDEYLCDLTSVFKSIYDITSENGTLWIIIDTFKRNNQLVPLPFDLANRLQEIGWYLQDVLIWKKDKTVPWSKNGFIQRKFEYILFLSKTMKFKSNRDTVRVYDTAHLRKWWVKYPERYNPKGKALDEIWEFPIPTQGSWGDEYIRHFCPLPKEMVATMIQLSTDENDIVLDPFAGSGTVLSQSSFMKRNYIGFELNQSYIDMFCNYLEVSYKLNRKEYDLFIEKDNQVKFENTILELRSLKYARVLLVNIQKHIGFKNFKIFTKIKEKSCLKNKLIKVEYLFFGKYDEAQFLELIDEIVKRQPLSKFGIEPIFSFLKSLEVDEERHFGYTSTNTHSYVRDSKLTANRIRIISDICVTLNEKDYL